MKKLPWLLGGGLLTGALLLWPRESKAAKRPVRSTINENKFEIAMARLSDFIRAAHIDAKAYKIHIPDGMILGVQPGAKFVVEDSRAIPLEVDGLDVLIKGWPRR